MTKPLINEPAHKVAKRMLRAVGLNHTDFRLRDSVAMAIAPELDRLRRLGRKSKHLAAAREEGE